MRICYVAADVAVPYYRGSSTHVYELARNLAKLGHQVHVVARRVTSSQPKLEVLDGIVVHRYQRGMFFSSTRSSFAQTDAKGSYRGGTPLLVWKSYEAYLMTVFPAYVGVEVARLVKESSIDIIFERESSFGAGVVASYMTSRPLFLEVIGDRYTGAQLKRARKVFAYSSSSVAERLERERLEVTSAAVNPDRFRPDPKAGKEVRKRYAIGDVPVVGYVGSFHEWHGVGEIIDASSLILRHNPLVKILMVGPYYQGVLEAVTKRGMAGSFIFPGAVRYELVPDFMSACDVLVAPYNPSKFSPTGSARKRTLGSPLKLFEYMSVEKPLVSTKVEPVMSVIQDRVTGLLVPAGDSHALAEAILELLEDKNLARRLAKNAKAEVVEKYSWNAVAARTVLVMEEAMAG